MEHLSVEQMTLADLNLATEWAATEGWNPGLHDAPIFYQTDPQGFFVGKIDGNPVASISAVRYGLEYGFIGFYIVAPEYRDHGYGGHLILHARKHLEGFRSVGLDGVDAQQANYARHGAVYAHDNHRFEGHGPGEVIPLPHGAKMLPLAEIPFELVLDYDRRHFPADRSGFMNAWINQPDSLALGILCSLFADDSEAASALISELRQGLRVEEPFYMDVPAFNLHAMALAEQLGMKTAFHTARMYLGEAPVLPTSEIYGITSLELG